MPSIGPESEVDSAAVYLELRGCVFRGVKGFFAKYFEGQSWTAAAEQVAENTPLDIASALCKELLELKSQAHFHPWLSRLQSIFLADGQKAQICLANALDRPLGAMVYLVKPADKLKNTNNPPATDVRVFGDFGLDATDIGPDSVLRFCEMARQVFQARPTRRFLHGFQIRGSTMELWMFDRSGAFSSEQLDLAGLPRLLIRIMASYALMPDEEVGFTSFIQHDGRGSYVAFGGADDNETARLYLLKPIAAPQYLVGPGTTCYAATTSASQHAGFVVKFAWREETTHTECELLKLTKDRHVRGVIRAFGWQDLLDSIQDLRKGLRFHQPYDLMPVTENKWATSEGDTLASTATGSATNPDPQFINRILSCIATAPLGRSINKFDDIPEFLEACRDVVKALKSLYEDGRILHRDICVKNLIIPDRCRGEDAKGVLIDLDGALDLGKGPARKGELVGSEGFMAIGILTGDPHTYRHDLESLFYVFLWVSICNDREYDDERSLRHQPETSRLRGWCSTNFRAVSQNKLVDMSPDGFPRILAEFSTAFSGLRGLATELHQLLFPIRDEEIFTGTDMDQAETNRLYNGIIDAFNRAIAFSSQE